MIILDTDILIEIYDKKSPAGDAALKRIEDSGDLFYTTVINVQEILYGLFKYAKQSDTILQMPVLDYTKEDARLAAELEWRTELKGAKLSRADAIVAAIAINNDAKLYTNNKKHFSAIGNLKLL